MSHPPHTAANSAALCPQCATPLAICPIPDGEMRWCGPCCGVWLDNRACRALVADGLSVWRPVWELAYRRPYQTLVDAESKRSGVPPHLIYAIMREESAFKPHAVSPAAAYGLMQLVVATAKTMARPLSLPSSPAAP